MTATMADLPSPTALNLKANALKSASFLSIAPEPSELMRVQPIASDSSLKFKGLRSCETLNDLWVRVYRTHGFRKLLGVWVWGLGTALAGNSAVSQSGL